MPLRPAGRVLRMAFHAGAPAAPILRICLALLALLPAACATQTLPPDVELIGVAATPQGLAARNVLLMLCITNPDREDVTLAQTTFRLDVGGRRILDDRRDTPMQVPAGGAALVPLATPVLIRNLQAQLGEMARSGEAEFRLGGRVVPSDFPIGIPYAESGRIGLQVASRWLQLRPLEEPSPACRALRRS